MDVTPTVRLLFKPNFLLRFERKQERNLEVILNVMTFVTIL
jgi:hypothetical protein